ncbi:MAG TPA: methyltransferase domain-containing protein [Geminicoccaceae bacterium]|nr:methyltransferase domain-containing protein [Geminicoccus sp.]HMU49885.1 methyltransferase domain-containing protein [Geminicoccaceae bacterium]
MSQPTGDYEGDHRAYLQSAGAGPPRATLLAALDAFAGEGRPAGHALDLGCGIGRDTLPILGRGWTVTAIDRDPEALAVLRRRAGDAAGLTVEPGRFEDLALPPCELVNASFALPLCPPSRFAGLWTRIGAALRPGGRFAGQLYGPEDGWKDRPGMTFHSRPEVEALLAGWSVERLDEDHADAVTQHGKTKHWHIWHVVARKPG